jgi:hypothetical protein
MGVKIGFFPFLRGELSLSLRERKSGRLSSVGDTARRFGFKGHTAVLVAKVGHLDRELHASDERSRGCLAGASPSRI